MEFDGTHICHDVLHVEGAGGSPQAIVAVEPEGDGIAAEGDHTAAVLVDTAESQPLIMSIDQKPPRGVEGRYAYYVCRTIAIISVYNSIVENTCKRDDRLVK